MIIPVQDTWLVVGYFFSRSSLMTPRGVDMSERWTMQTVEGNQFTHTRTSDTAGFSSLVLFASVTYSNRHTKPLNPLPSEKYFQVAHIKD